MFGETGAPLLAAAWLGRGNRPVILMIVFGLSAIGNGAVPPTTASGGRHDGPVLLLSKDKLEFKSPAIVRWNTFSRIMANDDEVGRPVLWGPSAITPPLQISQRHLDIDGSAATAMYRFDGDISKLDFLRYDITNIAYAIRNHGRSAVIGVGGGRDLLSAYLFGFRDITGVELNPIFIDFLPREFRDYNHLADLPGVRLFVDEARSWFARTNEHFDLIEMSLIDTWAATGAGAYSLSENGLYTTQGWHHFLSALTPTGEYTVSRWFNPNDITETGRLLSLAAQALREEGVERPEQHMFMAGSNILATLIVSKSPLTAEEVAQLRARVGALKFNVLLSPDQTDRSPVLTRIVDARNARDLAALSLQQHLDVSVTTDDRPFFFNQLNALDLSSIQHAINSTLGVVHGNLLATVTLLIIVVFSAILVLFTMIIPSLPAVRQTPLFLAKVGPLYFLLIRLGLTFGQNWP